MRSGGLLVSWRVVAGRVVTGWGTPEWCAAGRGDGGSPVGPEGEVPASFMNGPVVLTARQDEVTKSSFMYSPVV